MYVRTIERKAFIGPPATVTELRLQRCTWCSTVVFRTCLLCPACSSTDLRWMCSPGTGKVVSAVEIRRKGQPPGTLAVVELGDGVRVRCEVEDSTGVGVAPSGAPVSIVEVRQDGMPLFRVDPVRSERW